MDHIWAPQNRSLGPDLDHFWERKPQQINVWRSKNPVFRVPRNGPESVPKVVILANPGTRDLKLRAAALGKSHGSAQNPDFWGVHHSGPWDPGSGYPLSQHQYPSIYGPISPYIPTTTTTTTTRDLSKQPLAPGPAAPPVYHLARYEGNAPAHNARP